MNFPYDYAQFTYIDEYFIVFINKIEFNLFNHLITRKI